MKNTINQNIQILAHTQEKYKFINEEAFSKNSALSKIELKVHNKKEDLKRMKQKHEQRSLKNYNEKKRIDDINSANLIGYYKSSHLRIRDNYLQIQDVVRKLEKYRNTDNMKDILMLKKRADKIFHEEYTKLIIFDENTEKINN